MKRLLIALLALSVSLLTTTALGAEKTGLPQITEKNWDRHPLVVEIRNIYKEIKAALDKKQLTYQEKDFTKLPRSCRGTYPLEKLALAADPKGNVRLYITARRISHGDLLTIERYYDGKGMLRFVYMKNSSDEYATIENRVYLNEKGRVFWDVKTEAGKTAFGEITDDDEWIVGIKSGAAARNEFVGTEVKCSE
jgi:hypothetical protein